MKTLKFKDNLARLILQGKKDSTWRLFDDKDLRAGDEVEFINSESKQKFARATLTEVREKKMKDLNDADFEGHERFSSEEEMYKAYRSYYSDSVGPETLVKIIRFRISK